MSDFMQYPITVKYLENTQDSLRVAKSECYELIVCTKGKGLLQKVDVSVAFGCHHFFFINKGQNFQIDLYEDSTYYRCQFTEDVKLVLKNLIDQSSGKAIAPLRMKSVGNPSVICSADDTLLLIELFNLMRKLQCNFLQNLNLMYYQLLCVIRVVERNIVLQPKSEETGIPKLTLRPIIKHIHKNLRTPEMLSLAFMASTFQLSKNRLGSFFKEEMNISVKQYILQIRMDAIAKKIALGGQSFSELSHEFGFTDESHFYKTFKKQYGKSPSAYRKQNKVR